MTKLISLSLFGSGDKYNLGALENARLAPIIYPGWVCRFYCDPEATVVSQLEDLGCETVRMDRAPGAKAMSWRFIPAADSSLERVIFRDSDSRLNVREAAAVAGWIASGLPVHAMHDHLHHKPFPVFGGMWGCVGGHYPSMQRWIDGWPAWAERMDDMNLLTKFVQPGLNSATCLRHSSVPLAWDSVPFPEHPTYDGFVGQQFN